MYIYKCRREKSTRHELHKFRTVGAVNSNYGKTRKSSAIISTIKISLCVSRASKSYDQNADSVLPGRRSDNRARLTIVLADVLLIIRQNKYRNRDPSPVTFKNLNDAQI